MAMFLIIAFLPLMLIMVIMIIIIASIIAIISPDTINNFINSHSKVGSGIFVHYNPLTPNDSGGDEPGWLLGAIMKAVFAILYIILLNPCFEF